jgi:hypothetical protein
MAAFDFRDFYILYEGHPKYQRNEIIEDEVVSVIIQKLEVLLFSNKGDLLGEPDFGADLSYYLYETKVPADFVKKNIHDQITRYIPELTEITYSVDVVFAQDPLNFQDIMFINIKFGEFDVYAQIGKFN